MKRKYKCNCDDLAREIIERNLRGFIRKAEEAEDALNVSEADHEPPVYQDRTADVLIPHPDRP